MGLKFEAMSGEILGAAVEVHRALGPGFLETIYEAALCFELGLRGVPYQRQVEVPVAYKGREVGRHRLDLVVNSDIVVEIKVAAQIVDAHRAQTLSYLRATSIPVGLILNFGLPTLETRRIVS